MSAHVVCGPFHRLSYGLYSRSLLPHVVPEHQEEFHLLHHLYIQCFINKALFTPGSSVRKSAIKPLLTVPRQDSIRALLIELDCFFLFVSHYNYSADSISSTLAHVMPDSKILNQRPNTSFTEGFSNFCKKMMHNATTFLYLLLWTIGVITLNSYVTFWPKPCIQWCYHRSLKTWPWCPQITSTVLLEGESNTAGIYSLDGVPLVALIIGMTVSIQVEKPLLIT